MSDFRFLEQFKVIDVNQDSALDHKLYSENLSDIAISEDKLGFPLPKELKDFYTQIGYGFFWQLNKSSFDRFLAANQVVQINLKEDFYEFDPDLELYDQLYHVDKLLFFEVNEGIYLAIDKKDENGKNAIYYFKDKIADSLESFIKDFIDNENLLKDFSQ